MKLLRAIAGVAAIALSTGCELEPFPIPTSLDAGVTDDAGDAGDASSTGDAGPEPECTVDGECDDGNPCTSDACTSGECVATVTQGASCADADLCDGAEVCDASGQCAAGTPVAVDDMDPCTTDACDPATGTVSHAPIAGCGAGWTTTSTVGAPAPRERHTAVWTGTQMIVWGGNVVGMPSVTATGGRYDPATDTWAPIATAGAPAPRHSHRAAWTGDRMIVWGGYGAMGYEAAGGIYDPATDTWTATTIAGAPVGRTDFTAVWTGSRFVVWGGFSGTVLGSGASYDPALDAWAALPSGSTPRYAHSAVWAGDRMIVWGGNDLSDWHKDGWAFDPVAGTWALLPLAGAPEARESHTAIWTGDTMIVWGGWTGGPYINSGGAYDVAAGTWSALDEGGAPSPRMDHAAAWTGSKMVIWGGCGEDVCMLLRGDGGVWTPGANGGTWEAIPEDAKLSARKRGSLVWTGSEVIYWGGRTASGLTNTGARRDVR